MTETMTIENYLAEGGILTSPSNVPARYRAELMRIMAAFVDSELAGAAGFADVINQGPGIKERIAAAKIVLEKTDSADKVLHIMGEFGADTQKYVTHHPWTARLDRAADVGAKRTDSDQRLPVFNFPLIGWVDAVTMNLLMGKAVCVQLQELMHVSYQPLADSFRTIAEVEGNHSALALEGVERLLETGANKAEINASLSYWWPRVASSFVSLGSDRAKLLMNFGLRHQTNDVLKKKWAADTSVTLKNLGLDAG